MKFKVPRNIPGVLGLALFAAAIVSFAFLLLVDIMQGHGTDPYAGLFAWVVLPMVGTAGLALLALGYWLRKRAQAAQAPQMELFDAPSREIAP